MTSRLDYSAALWNRSGLDLASDEMLAQILDRGSVEDWRALYRLAGQDSASRSRIGCIIATVPLPLPHFWLAALAGLGERVDFDMPVPEYPGEAAI